MSELNLRFAGADLEPFIRDIVQKTISEAQELFAKLSDKLCHSEEEAARLLGLKTHQLRDARRSGKIGFSRITGNRVRYSPEDLLEYLQANHTEPTGA